jgi:hypothetical protein
VPEAEEKMIAFIEDYFRRYKSQTTVAEIREDFYLAFEEEEARGTFATVWAKLKHGGRIVLVPRSRPGQDSVYQWAPQKP